MENIKQRLLVGSILVAGLGLYLPLYKQIYKLSAQSFPGLSAKFEEPIKAKKPCNKVTSAFRSHVVPQKDIVPLGDSQAPPVVKGRERVTLPSSSFQIGIAISPDGTEIYQLTNNGIEVINQETGEQKNFKLPRKFPELSWGTDIAYDSKRDIVSLVSFGGEGYFYRFDAQKRRWLDAKSVNNIDIKSLSYDRDLDRYIAWADGNLWFISGTGELLFIDHLGDRLTRFEQLDNRDRKMPSLMK